MTGLIEVKLMELNQLFNSMDPSPFHERDLDHDAEEFIVSWAQEHPKQHDLKLVVHLTKHPAGVADARQLVADSVSHYFEYRADMTLREFLSYWPAVPRRLPVHRQPALSRSHQLGERRPRRPHHHRLGGHVEAARNLPLPLVAFALLEKTLSAPQPHARRSPLLRLNLKLETLHSHENSTRNPPPSYSHPHARR
jgi:hypothetical protein